MHVSVQSVMLFVSILIIRTRHVPIRHVSYGFCYEFLRVNMLKRDWQNRTQRSTPYWMGGAFSQHGTDERYEYKIFLDIPEGEGPLRLPRPRRESNVKTDHI